MKATFKDRKPVSSAEIIEDIRAGAQKTLQPVVQAGARFRQEHPAAAQRISVAVRAPPKKYQQLEQRVAAKIPTLQNISQMGAKFRQSNPVAADKLYTTFQKAHAKTERVGTIEQRNALAGYTYGSYQSLQQQPVKTAAMFAVGLGSGKALSVIGQVGKAYGAGKWSARAAKGAQLGLLTYYGKQSYNHIMSAPNSYIAGQRAAKIMYTEILPMAAGIKAAQVAPKVAKIVIRKTGFISKEFKAGTKRMLADNRAQTLAGKTQKQRLDELVRKEEARLKRPLLESEYKALEGLVGMKQPKAPRTVKTAKDLFKKIDAENKRKVDSGKYTEVKQKDGTVLLAKVMQKPLVKVEQKVLTEQALKQVVKLKQEFRTLQEPKAITATKPVVKQKQFTKVKQEQFQTFAQAKEAQRLKALQESRIKAKTKVKVATQTVQKVKAEVKTATKVKVKTKAQQKTKLAVLLRLKQKQKAELVVLQKVAATLKADTKAAQKPKQKQKGKVILVALTPKSKQAVAMANETIKAIEKAIAEEKAAARELTRAIRAIEALKFKVPPIVPIKKIPTKKKITKRQREMMVLKQKNLNAVATFKDLLGGL